MTTVTDAESAERPRWLGALGRALDSRLDRLQKAYLRESPSARADLARLRRGLGKAAGSVPEIWALTVGAVPPRLAWDRDEPSFAEQAAHAALTLYAVHQQSKPVPMHVRGVSFGHAVGRLRSSGQFSEEAVTRRFMAAATAGSAEGALIHLRGLITQLRTERIGFDYAAFADDLVGLLTPGRAQQVRLAWGRAFYRVTNESESEPDTVTEDRGEQS